jgi:transcriptional regulator with XRE-family HTH domain
VTTPASSDAATAYDRTLGNVLRKRRQAMGWTRKDVRAQFKERLGRTVSTQTLATYEYGSRHMLVATLREHALVYRTEPHLILAEVDRHFVTQAADVVVDLYRLARCTDPDLAPARGWARTQAGSLGMNAGHTTARELTVDALTDLAILCRLDVPALLAKLAGCRVGRAA